MTEGHPVPTQPQGQAFEADETWEQGFWRLRLYVAGHTARSVTALANLTRLCEAHLSGRYAIEVIDLIAQPDLAKRDQIIAIPTLVRRLPMPIRKIIGDLSNTERVLVGLDIRHEV